MHWVCGVGVVVECGGHTRLHTTFDFTLASALDITLYSSRLRAQLWRDCEMSNSRFKQQLKIDLLQVDKHSNSCFLITIRPILFFSPFHSMRNCTSLIRAASFSSLLSLLPPSSCLHCPSEHPIRVNLTNFPHAMHLRTKCSLPRGIRQNSSREFDSLLLWPKSTTAPVESDWMETIAQWVCGHSRSQTNWNKRNGSTMFGLNLQHLNYKNAKT